MQATSTSLCSGTFALLRLGRVWPLAPFTTTPTPAGVRFYAAPGGVEARKLRGLREVLGCSEDKVRKIAASYSQLLSRDPELIGANVSALSEVLGCSEDEVRKIAVSETRLLRLNPESGQGDCFE